MAGASPWAPSPNLPKERVSFAGVGHDEMVARARGLAPMLKERVGETEALRRLPEETERDLHARGLFRIAQPARVGGAELDIGIFVEVCAEIARVCPSTAWNLGNLAAHHWMLGYFPPAAQDEIWDVSPDTLVATSLAFPCGAARPVEGGFIVGGRWPFSSGVDNCDWNMLAVTVREGGKAIDHRFALLHRSQYEIIDNWHALGLCGTGSKDVATKECFVPQYRTAPAEAFAGSGHAGSAVNPGPLFRLPMLAIGTHVLSGVALGCAEGAYRSYVGAARRRNTTYGGTPVGGHQAVQIKVAEAAALIDGAALMMREDCRHATEVAKAGKAPSLDDKLRYRRNGAWSVTQCRSAVDILMGLSGAGGLYTTGEMPRYFRDSRAIGAHIIYSFDVQGTMFGQHALGIPLAPPML
jgi:3-hydroxy-9,10-secoandrosta-1,3,5(10)-triene-9,17-dione monooxygenase